IFMQDSPGAAYCLAMSRDGKLVATGGNMGIGITVWEVDTGKEYAWFKLTEPGWTQGLSFNSDNTYLVNGSSSHLITLWDLKAKKKMGVFNGHTNEVYAVSFSHDDKLLVSAGVDSVVRVWNVEKRKELLAFPGGSAYV